MPGGDARRRGEPGRAVGAFAAAVGAAVLAGVVRGFSGFGSALVLVAVALGALRPGGRGPGGAAARARCLSGPFVPPALRVVDRRRTAILCVAAAVTVPVGA